MLILLLLLPLVSGYKKKVVGCEGSEVKLWCEEGTVISVIRANYGRISSSVCADTGRHQTWSTRCIQPRTLREVTSRCSSGDSQCSLQVSSQVFGDPCPDTPKYLEVVYTCQSREQVTQPPLLPPWLLSLEAMEDVIRRQSTPSTSTTTSPPPARREEESLQSNEIPPVAPSPLVRQPSTEFLSYLQEMKERARENTVSLLLNNPREKTVVSAEILDRDVIAAIAIASIATVVLLVAVIIICCCKARSERKQEESDLESSSSTYLSYGPGKVERTSPNVSPFTVKCSQTGQTYEYTTRQCRQAGWTARQYDNKR